MSIAQPDFLEDTLEIRVTLADDLALGDYYYILNYLDEDSLEFVQSETIMVGCSETEMKNAIKAYYADRFSVNPNVALTYFDSAGAETTSDGADILTYVYTVTVPRPISQASVGTIVFVSLGTLSTVDFTYPADLQLSDPPISGMFYINCADLDGDMYATTDMDIVSASAADFQAILENDCSFVRGLIEVERITDTYSDRNIGVEFQIRFNDVP